MQQYHPELATGSLLAGLVLAAVVVLVDARADARADALVGVRGTGDPGWMTGHPLGRWTLVLCVTTLAGTWAGVPDTEPPLVCALVLAPLALWWAWRDRAPGAAFTVVLVALIVWAAWTGSAGWGAARASIGAVGMLVSAPAVFGFWRFDRRGPDGYAEAVLVGVQLAVGLALPRLVMRRDVPVAVAVSCAAFVGTAVICVVLRGRLGPRYGGTPERGARRSTPGTTGRARSDDD